MINIKILGLNEDQEKALSEALMKENFYFDLLREAGIHQSAITNIMKISDTSKIDIDHKEQLKEMIKEEYKDFIIERKSNNEKNL